MLLGLDIGTTNVKAAVFDDRGSVVGRASRPVQLLHTPDGGVEQDFEEIWSAVLACIREAAATTRSDAIRAIGVSSQGGAMQVVDGSGQCLGRVISWLDQRGAPFNESLTRELGEAWFRERILHGGSWLAIGQLLRLREQAPESLRPPNRIGFVGDLVVGRLCGRGSQDGTSAALTLLYDPRQRTYCADLLERLGVTAAQLPALLSPVEPAGPLTFEAAKATGLPPGITVGPAVHDQYASALGTGVVEEGTVMLGTGTAWVLLATSRTVPRPAHADALLCHHVIEPLWGQILSMVFGGSVVRWAAELAGISGAESAEIDRLLATVPAGAEGLQFWPFFASSTPLRLAPGTRGRISGLQLHHRASHLLRAAVEGLAFELKRTLELLEAGGHSVRRLVMSGGAAASQVTPSILADVTGLPVACYSGEASLIGAGLLARALILPGVPLAQLSARMAAPFATFSPTPRADTYSRLYAQYAESLPLDR